MGPQAMVVGGCCCRWSHGGTRQPLNCRNSKYIFLKSGDTVGKLPAGRVLVTDKEQKSCTIYRGTQYKNPIMTKLV